MPTARFFFDARSGTLLWAAPEDQPVWDYPIDLARLPVSEELRAELERLLDEYDTSLDWNDPGGPTPWDAARCRSFNTAARQAIARLRTELGPDWRILDTFTEVRTDG
jgi:hypothetical protein